MEVESLEICKLDGQTYLLSDSVIQGIKIVHTTQKKLDKRIGRKKYVCLYYFYTSKTEDGLFLKFENACIARRKRKGYHIVIQSYGLYKIVYNGSSNTNTVHLIKLYY